MLRLPAYINLGPYILHLDVLAARLQRQRRGAQRFSRWALFLLLVGMTAGIGLPLFRGTGVIVVPEHDASITFSLNGRALTSNSLRVSSGRHVVRVERVGAFPVDQTVEVTKEQTTTLTIPNLRPIPRVQQLPLPAQGSSWAQVSPDAGGGWRITANQPASPDTTNRRPGWGTTTTSAPRTLLHVDAAGVTPLLVLETDSPTDEIVTSQGERFTALWETQRVPNASGIAGKLSFTTPSGTQTLSTTAVLSGLWWSPSGHKLLVAIARDQLVDLALLDPEHAETEPIEAIISIPGAIQSVDWHPDERGVVITSSLEEAPEQPQLGSRPTQIPQDDVSLEPMHAPRSAVLIRLPISEGKPQAIRLHASPAYPSGIVPLDWSEDDLWWVTDTGLGVVLEQVSLSNDAVRRVGELPQGITAFTVLSDMTIRIIRASEDKQLVVERWPETTPLFVLPDITVRDGVGGIWRGDELILATNENELWYVHVDPEALQ